MQEISAFGLLEQVSKTWMAGAPFQTAPPKSPAELEALFRKDQEEARRELLDASQLPKETVDAIRHRVYLADTDGFLGVPSYAGDLRILTAMMEGIDEKVHQEGCHLEKLLHADLDLFSRTLAPRLHLAVSDVRKLLDARCVSGPEGLRADICEIRPAAGGSDRTTFHIGHMFLQMAAVAAKVCAALLGPLSGPNPVPSEEVERALSLALNWVRGRSNQTPVDPLASHLVSFQLYVADQLLTAMRRFALAHELSHLLLTEKIARFPVLWSSAEQQQGDLCFVQEGAGAGTTWATEIAADLVAVDLLTAATGPVRWTYCGVDLSLTLWHVITGNLVGQANFDYLRHPPMLMRRMVIRHSIPSNLQSLGHYASRAFLRLATQF